MASSSSNGINKNMNNNVDSNKKRIRRKKSSSSAPTSGNNLNIITDTNDSKSILFTLLIWGLIFCMIHVVYVFTYVDNNFHHHHHISSSSSSNTGAAAHEESSSSSHKNNNNNNNNNGKTKLQQLLAHKNEIEHNKRIGLGGGKQQNQQQRRKKLHDGQEKMLRNSHIGPGGNVISNYNGVDDDKHNDERNGIARIHGNENENGNANDEDNNNNGKLYSTIEDLSYITSNDPRYGKEKIIEILNQAGIKQIDLPTIKRLPYWSNVTDLYGDKPIIYGLNDETSSNGIDNQCKKFQNIGNKYDHFVSTAGTFNSGTNLMAELLINNCHMKDRMKKYGQQNRGIRWQVPWGKHNPPNDYRGKHSTYDEEEYDADTVLPAVPIRDPYVWLNSMCRHRYRAHWLKDPDNKHCPNLLPNDIDRQANVDLMKLHHGKPNMYQAEAYTGPYDVKYNYTDTDETLHVRVDYPKSSTYHTSLIHLWNDWYDQYYNTNVTFPRLIVRYEDLLFFAKDVTKLVCECAGGSIYNTGFQYVVGSAKKGTAEHGTDRTGLIEAIIKYGSAKDRYNGFTYDDLLYVKNNVNTNMMKYFNYIHPPASIFDELLKIKQQQE